MHRVPKGSYTKEFREQAVKLVLVDGLSQREAELARANVGRRCSQWNAAF